MKNKLREAVDKAASFYGKEVQSFEIKDNRLTYMINDKMYGVFLLSERDCGKEKDVDFIDNDIISKHQSHASGKNVFGG